MKTPQPEQAFLERVISARRSGDTLISFAGNNYTVDMLSTRSSLLARGVFAGKSVLLMAREALDCALCLLELDGVARRIVICPPDLSTRHLTAISKQAEVDVVIGDNSEEHAALFDAGVERTTVHRLAIPKTHLSIPHIETEWVLLTSGTTAEPKLVVHDFKSLTLNIRKPDSTSEPIIWSSFNDTRRFSGLQMFLHALLTDSTLVMKPVDMTVADFLPVLEATGATHVSGTPTHWRKVLMYPGRSKLKLSQITLVGEIADQPILDALHHTYPYARITHIYGSTETGTGFSVHDGQEGFPSSFLGKNKSGLELAAIDGMLMIRSDRAAHRYLGQVEKPLRDATGFIESGDLIKLRGDRYCFLGRKSGAVNIGGSRVHPEEVEAALNADQRIRMSAVSAKKNSFTGSILVADVVLAEPLIAPLTPQEMTNQLLVGLRKKLEPYKIPATIRYVKDIAEGSAGNLERRGG